MEVEVEVEDEIVAMAGARSHPVWDLWHLCDSKVHAWDGAEPWRSHGDDRPRTAMIFLLYALLRPCQYLHCAQMLELRVLRSCKQACQHHQLFMCHGKFVERHIRGLLHLCSASPHSPVRLHVTVIELFNSPL